jgi:hypothetical protein
MATVPSRAYASFAVSALALAVALGGGASWAATATAAPHSSLTCVVVKRSGFKNGWHNLGSPFRPAQACKDSLGFVHLDGVLTGGTPNTTALVLPAGYRPRFDKVFAVTGTNGGVPVLEDIFLLPGGLVFARGSAKDAVGLDGVVFSAGG